jgi:hypothetical protein
LVENELRSTDTHFVCYFFFKDNEDQDSLADALCALLHQLFSAQHQLIHYAMNAFEKNGEKLRGEVGELWRILLAAATSQEAQSVICVLDALDECREKDRQMVIQLLSEFYTHSLSHGPGRNYLKFLVTSRPYDDIQSGFQAIPPDLPVIRLLGEEENDEIHKEIDLVVRQRVADMARTHGLNHRMTEVIEQKLLGMENRTYLWLHLAMKIIGDAFNDCLRPDTESLETHQLPSTVEEAYEKILGKIISKNKKVVKTIFHIIVGARRPLTTSELAAALGIATNEEAQSFKDFHIDPNRLDRRIRSWCGLFVFINHSRIYLIHQTARAFLIKANNQDKNGCWKHCLEPKESEAIMARISTVEEIFYCSQKSRTSLNSHRSGHIWPYHGTATLPLRTANYTRYGSEER